MQKRGTGLGSGPQAQRRQVSGGTKDLDMLPAPRGWLRVQEVCSPAAPSLSRDGSREKRSIGGAREGSTCTFRSARTADNRLGTPHHNPEPGTVPVGN